MTYHTCIYIHTHTYIYIHVHAYGTSICIYIYVYIYCYILLCSYNLISIIISMHFRFSDMNPFSGQVRLLAMLVEEWLGVKLASL